MVRDYFYLALDTHDGELLAMVECFKAWRQYLEGAQSQIRAGSTQECANVVTMLARTGYITGQSILLSGGLK